MSNTQGYEYFPERAYVVEYTIFYGKILKNSLKGEVSIEKEERHIEVYEQYLLPYVVKGDAYKNRENEDV